MMLKDRKLITSDERKISIVQMLGFGLIIAGLIAIIISAFTTNNPSVIAIGFFITMLGFAFAFPSLLEGNDGLSTMRIVVFMMVNVICLLLIKIGWNENIHSLEDIGLNQWWMGVIAFIFGAKATQSFFESRMAVPKSEISKVGTAALEYTNAEIAKLAVAQNEQYLRAKFPNIVSVSDAVHDLNQMESHIVTLYLKDSNTVGIPVKLEVKMPDGSVKTIGTEIVRNVGEGKIHIAQCKDNISDVQAPDYLGSICCLVKSTTNPNFIGVVTSGHVYSNGFIINKGGVLGANQQTDVLINNSKMGKWFVQLINNRQDLAIAQLNETDLKALTDEEYFSFSAGYYNVTDKDVKTLNPNVSIISKNNKVRDAYIIDYNVAFELHYQIDQIYMNNIILIGSKPERNHSTTVSEEGDSGSCVYEKSTKKLIGMLLGGDDNFSFVLPIKDTLDYYNFKPI